MKGQKILIIGGAGFIGSNLCSDLSPLNTVTSLDNYSLGNESNHVAGVRYIRGEAAEISKIFIDEKFDYLFHFGEYSRVEQSFAEIDHVLQNNINGFLEVLKFAKDHVGEIIYSASSTVFNKPENGTLLSPYTLSKKINVEILRNYCFWANLRYKIVYFYNAFGPNEISHGPYSTVVAKYINLINSGHKKLPVHGTGHQTRNFTHVSDIVSGIILAVTKGKNYDFGIGNPTSWSILDLVRLFEAEPEFLPDQNGNRKSSPLNNSEILSLGWRPKHALDEYITKSIKKSY